MSVISKALTTLADVKLIAGIPVSDTSKDSFLEKLINQQSMAIAKYCDRDFQSAEFTESYSGNGAQYLALDHYPITLIDSITEDGIELTVDTDYYLSDEDASNGVIYKPYGWSQDVIRGGMTEDPIAKVRNIDIVYTGGYLLPGDTGYTEGADDSLPSDLSFVCAQMVIDFFMKTRRGANGLTSMSEGGLSYSWKAPTAENNTAGINPEYAGVLNTYKRLVVA